MTAAHATDQRPAIPPRPYRFGIVGGGWRAETFVRIAQRAPEWFECAGVVVRDPEKRAAFAAKTGAPGFGTFEALSERGLDFGVSSVSWQGNPQVIRQFADGGIPVLAETPPAPGREEMAALCDLLSLGARVQVAEQVALRPLYQAMAGVVRAGLLGAVHHVQVSVAHGYHGVSVLEELLGVVGQAPEILAVDVSERSLAGPGRDGDPSAETVNEGGQTLAILRYPGGKSAVFDFTGTQYFSAIRKSRVLVRGERGEMDQDGVRWVPEFYRPVEAAFRRQEAGRFDDLSPLSLRSVTLGERTVYENPFFGASLQDDEIAMASLMLAVAEGRMSYPLGRAMHDHALAMAIGDAARSGGSVRYAPGLWDAG